MAERRIEVVEVEIVYDCDTGDGGSLIAYEAPTLDNQGESAFKHYCTNPKDQEVYLLKMRYPRRDWQVVNTDIIKA